MKKQALSLFLALVLIAGLFAGLSMPASANGEIGHLFDRYLTGDRIDALFEDARVVASGSCGSDGRANVQYRIYRIDPEKVKELTSDQSILDTNEKLKNLRERFPDFNIDGENLLPDLELDLPEGMDFYAVKLFGNGEMADYTMTNRAPWGGHVTIDGEDVDLEEQLIAAYVQGPDSTYKTGVTNVGARAFFGQDRLTLVYLGESVTSIGEKAFETCDLLSAINFPSGLTSIGRRAFYACDSLTFARMNGCTQLTRIEDRAFCTCSRLTSVWFPQNITSIGKFAFAWDHVLGTEEFALPAYLQRIETGAFAFCTHLGTTNEVNIPGRVTNIGDWAFTCCFGLKGLEFSGGENALSIGIGSFAGCSALQSVTFPNRVRNFGNYCFAACDKLEDVIFGDKDGTEALHAAKIGERAFVSLEDTGLTALRGIADAFKQVDSGDAEYLDGSRAAAEAASAKADTLADVTPLKRAAFGSTPPAKDAVEAADEDTRSFPTDVTIYYPTQEYNSRAHGQWSAVVSDGKWYGYNCEPTWTGHYHVYGEPEVVPMTCTRDGYEVYTCTYWENGVQCGHVEEVVTQPATGHHSEIDMIEYPTCTEGGKTFYHCDNEWCDNPNYVVYTEPKGHDLDNLENREYKEPTCTEEGYVKGVCPDCGEYVSETIPARGHNTKYMELVTAPTCTKEGLYKGECPDCGFRTQQVVPALGHDWDEGHYTRRPTQTTDGTIVYTCKRCHEQRVETVQKLIHTHSYETVVTAPTCTQQGYTTYSCAGCGDTYTDDFVPALGHSWDAGRVTTPATATTDGVKTFTCTRCGETRKEVIPATGEPTPPPVSFVDVPPNEYYAAPVAWAVSKGVTNGIDPTHFGPDAFCTRGQAVTFLYRAAGSPAVSGTNPFADVHEDDYFYKAVLWAVSRNITNGTDPTHFSPEDTCTRGHIVTFLHRANGSVPASGQTNPFADVASGVWYYQPVLWAVSKNITNGTDPTHFSPDSFCTRGQIVTFLYRAENAS